MAETEFGDIPPLEQEGTNGSKSESKSDDQSSLEETKRLDSECEEVPMLDEGEELESGDGTWADSSGESIVTIVPPFHGTPALWKPDRTVPEMAFGFLFNAEERVKWAKKHKITYKKYNNPQWEAAQRVRRRLLPAIHKKHLPALPRHRQYLTVLLHDFFSSCVVVGTNKTDVEMEKTKDVELSKNIAELLGQTENEPKWYYIDVDHKWD